MRICAVQTRPVKGDIPGNIENHIRLIEPAVSCGAEVIVFPELSLTGYEPALSEKLAVSQDDSRLEIFQNISNSEQIFIGVGIPLKTAPGICIGMIIFRPNKAKQIYSKKYIHPDEEAFFVPGQNSADLIGNNIALAICYEISVSKHLENALENGAEIYMASVAKFINGIDPAIKRLSDIAKKTSMTVLMANSVGQSDGHQCAGKTTIWNHKGLPAGQLNGTSEGILVFDTLTLELIEKTFVG